MSKEKEGYVNVELPEGLVKEIDALIERGEIGFKKRDEFVTAAVRRLIDSYTILCAGK